MKLNVKRLICVMIMGVFLTGSTVLADTGTCGAGTLNVRSGPGLSYSVINYMHYGEKAPITFNCGNGWYEVYVNGRTGYVSSAYIYKTAGNDGWAAQSKYSVKSTVSNTSNASYTAPAATTQTTQYTAPAAQTTNKTYLGTFKLTAYCSCAKCCGTANNVTASGVYPTAGHTVAMNGIPFGTKLMINGVVYTVEDRGTPYGTVDIYCGSHQEALNFGLQVADVYQIS